MTYNVALPDQKTPSVKDSVATRGRFGISAAWRHEYLRTQSHPDGRMAVSH